MRTELEPTTPSRTPREQQRFLYLGRLSREKDIEWLVRCFGRIAYRLPEARLAIAGTGDSRRRLTRLARTMGLRKSLEWLGEIERNEVMEVLSEATALLHPAVTDTQALVLYEALLAGVPVVVRDTRLRWLREFGFEFRSGPTEALFAEAAEEILRGGAMLRAELQRENRAALDRFANASSVEHLVRLYERVVARSDPRGRAARALAVPA